MRVEVPTEGLGPSSIPEVEVVLPRSESCGLPPVGETGPSRGSIPEGSAGSDVPAGAERECESLAEFIASLEVLFFLFSVNWPFVLLTWCL